MTKKIGIIMLIAGVVALAAAILFAFAIGGVIVPILTFSSIIMNSVGIMLVRGKR